MCTNVSGETLNLTRIKTTCGCVVADIQSGDILPDETKVIGLTYNPNNHPGTIDANAFVYLSLSDEKPVARLTLRGNVLPGADEWARYPYIMGKLRLKQNRMEFNDVISGKRIRQNEFSVVIAESKSYVCQPPVFPSLQLFVRNRRLSVRREKLI